MQWLRQSTAVTKKMGPFLDSGDGNTKEESLTISQADIRLTKNGGAFAQTNNAAGATHDENAYYGVPLDATDTGTLGALRVAIHVSGALAVWDDFMVLPANVWDSLFGADKLQVDVVQWLGTACAAPTVAGVPEVDVTHMEGGTQTVADLKDFADAGYDPATKKVQGVVLADACTTLTGHTAQTGDNYARLGAPAGASVSADIAAIEAQTDDIGVAGAGLTDLGGMSTAMKAEVNSEVADVLNTDTISQMAQQLPPSTPTFREAIMYLYQYFRNKRTQTSSEIKMYAEDETTVIAKSTIGDDATTFTKGEFATGP